MANPTTTNRIVATNGSPAATTATVKRANGLASQDFLATAPKLTLLVDGAATDTGIEATPQEFSTGSYGWFFRGQVIVNLSDGRQVTVNIGCNAVVSGSKPK